MNCLCVCVCVCVGYAMYGVRCSMYDMYSVCMADNYLLPGEADSVPLGNSEQRQGQAKNREQNKDEWSMDTLHYPH